ncbi:MAG TPA: hypothetical protein P5137_02310 [Candidatus Brocadiia bacterium]|nr:hypothetical protein [Candidatus Brocadiia bacterium]
MNPLPRLYRAAPTPRFGVYLFLLLTAMGVLIAWLHAGPAGPSSYEAIVRAGVGKDLLAGLPRGRQGLVGSLKWAPLPTLLALPLMGVPALAEGRFPMAVAASIGSALVCVFLSRWWARYGMRETIRAPIAFALFLSPPMLRPILEGSSETLFAFFAISALANLIHWWESQDLRGLAYTALSTAGATYVHYQGALLILFALALFSVHLVSSRKRESYIEGALITLLLPGAYLVVLWFAANWLLMGDAFFFIRAIVHAAADGSLGLLLVQSQPWSACLAPALLGVLGWGLCRLAGRRRTLWTGLPVLAGCLLLWTGGVSAMWPAAPDPATAELRATVLPALVSSHFKDKIIVSGYRGYLLRRTALERCGALVHELNLYPDRIFQQTRGRRLYILVPNPRSPDPACPTDAAWEDATLALPGVFDHGARGLIFERAWTNWALYRVVRLDTPEQPV